MHDTAVAMVHPNFLECQILSILLSSTQHKSPFQALGVAIDRLLYGLLLMLVVWLPLPFASNRVWAMVGFFLAVAAMLGVALLNLIFRDRGYTALWRIRWPLGFLMGYCGLVWFQILPYGNVGEVTPLGDPWPYISRDLHQTRIMLLLSLAYASLFALVNMLCSSQQRVRGLMYTILASGVLQAMLGIFLFSVQAKYTLLFESFEHGDRLLGSFVNPNHLANYLCLCLCIGMGLLVAALATGTARSEQDRSNWRSGVSAFLAFLLSGKMVVRLFMVVLVIALVLTQSRGGNLAFGVALVMSGVLVMRVRKDLRLKVVALVISIVLVDVVVIGKWIGIDRVVERVKISADIDQATGHSRDLSTDARALIPQLAVPLVKARPWFGHGAGTFYTTIEPLNTIDKSHRLDHAHNDFVEIATDTGVVGLALLVAFALSAASTAWTLLGQSSRSLRFSAGVTVILALICTAIHGFVDFNLQIPANATLLVMLLALPWAVESATDHPPSQGRGHRLRE